MTSTTATTSIFDMTVAGIRRRHQGAVDAFHADVAKNGIQHAIGWASVPAMVGERVLDHLDRFQEAAAEYGVDEAIEMTVSIRDDVQRRIGYFDPTIHSTSASQTLASQAEWMGLRAVVDLIDELRAAREYDLNDAE